MGSLICFPLSVDALQRISLGLSTTYMVHFSARKSSWLRLLTVKKKLLAASVSAVPTALMMSRSALHWISLFTSCLCSR